VIGPVPVDIGQFERLSVFHTPIGASAHRAVKTAVYTRRGKHLDRVVIDRFGIRVEKDREHGVLFDVNRAQPGHLTVGCDHNRSGLEGIVVRSPGSARTPRAIGNLVIVPVIHRVSIVLIEVNRDSIPSVSSGDRH